MSTDKSTPTPSKPNDPTFRSYSTEQAKVYASQRVSYPDDLYDTVLQHHGSTGGHFGLLVDVGCGPGNATRDVARSFERAIGVDPGEAMIGAARDQGGQTKAGQEIVYAVGPAEELAKVEGLEEGSVDLLTSAMAVHWFDMDKFWLQAAKVLKPGGTVALWTCSSAYCHPSTPNRDNVLRVMFEFEREILAPYELVPNRLSRELYDNLPLPWTIAHPVVDFPQEAFVRKEWDRDGVLSNGETFFSGGKPTPVDVFLKLLGTASMVTRWREAHPELVGTPEDVLKVFEGKFREALGSGVDSVVLGVAMVILLFKKKEN